MTFDDRRFKIATIAAITMLTTAIHYGYVFEPIFGDAHWIHALHSRFCYIPIVIAASWFGIRGGLWTATAITITVIPFVFGARSDAHSFAGEIVEIVFYFALAVLIGALVDREFRARRRQEDMRLQLERSQKLSLVGQVAAGVAHELKNPLASIKGAVEIISDETTNENDRAEFKNILFREIKRMDGTVTEFLEFARPKPTRIEEIDLSTLLQSSLRQLEAQVSREHIQIAENIEPAILIPGDREKLHQLILNIMLNAMQASKSGDTVVVNLASSNDHVELSIKDNGEGISSENLERIFEPFYTTRATGSGLGLAIVKSIVDAHRGAIDITSESGKGASVVVKLPQKEGAR
ncbi:MAG: ATP-binding protein [Candidatus Zixiibacteriota bacterium]